MINGSDRNSIQAPTVAPPSVQIRGVGTFKAQGDALVYEPEPDLVMTEAAANLVTAVSEYLGGWKLVRSDAL